MYSLNELVILYEEIVGYKKSVFGDLKSIIKLRNNIVHGLPSNEISPSYIFNLFFNFLDQLWKHDWVTWVLKEIASFNFQDIEFDTSSRLNVYLKYMESYLDKSKIHKLLELSDKTPLYNCQKCNHVVFEFLLHISADSITNFGFDSIIDFGTFDQSIKLRKDYPLGFLSL